MGRIWWTSWRVLSKPLIFLRPTGRFRKNILTEQLGTSRRKLRHAMAILEDKSLISTVSRSGTHVTLNNSEVIEGRGTQEETPNFRMMKTRLGLERVAARMVSQVAGRSELLNIFHVMNLVKQRVDLHVSVDDADSNFHLMVVKASHNPYIIGMMMIEHLIREHYFPFRQQMLCERYYPAPCHADRSDIVG